LHNEGNNETYRENKDSKGNMNIAVHWDWHSTGARTKKWQAAMLVSVGYIKT